MIVYFFPVLCYTNPICSGMADPYKEARPDPCGNRPLRAYRPQVLPVHDTDCAYACRRFPGGRRFRAGFFGIWLLTFVCPE